MVIENFDNIIIVAEFPPRCLPLLGGQTLLNAEHPIS